MYLSGLQLVHEAASLHVSASSYAPLWVAASARSSQSPCIKLFLCTSLGYSQCLKQPVSCISLFLCTSLGCSQCLKQPVSLYQTLLAHLSGLQPVLEAASLQPLLMYLSGLQLVHEAASLHVSASSYAPLWVAASARSSQSPCIKLFLYTSLGYSQCLKQPAFSLFLCTSLGCSQCLKQPVSLYHTLLVHLSGLQPVLGAASLLVSASSCVVCR